MTSENTGADPFAEAWKIPESIHHCAQCGSNRCGSYTFSICMGKIPIYQGRDSGLVRRASPLVVATEPVGRKTIAHGASHGTAKGIQPVRSVRVCATVYPRRLSQRATPAASLRLKA